MELLFPSSFEHSLNGFKYSGWADVPNVRFIDIVFDKVTAQPRVEEGLLDEKNIEAYLDKVGSEVQKSVNWDSLRYPRTLGTRMTRFVPVDFDSCIPIFCRTVIQTDDFCNWLTLHSGFWRITPRMVAREKSRYQKKCYGLSFNISVSPRHIYLRQWYRQLALQWLSPQMTTVTGFYVC